MDKVQSPSQVNLLLLTSLVIYVHLSSLEAYKQQWSLYADKIYPILTEGKQAALDSINIIMEGITNASIIAMADAAKQKINHATDGPELKNTFTQTVADLTLAKKIFYDGKKEGYDEGKVDGYTEGYAASQATLPTDSIGTRGQAVVITKGEKSVTLINPDKVKYIKVTE